MMDCRCFNCFQIQSITPFLSSPQVLASQAVVEQLMENRYLALQRLMAFMVGHMGHGGTVWQILQYS